MRIFVCSPLRGPDGQPSEKNIKLARLLMRAVFEAGHQPFVPHLLYPQVLSEAPKDLEWAFAANYAWLDVSAEIWVYAEDLVGCSKGMRLEIARASEGSPLPSGHWRPDKPRVEFMPPPFREVKALLEAENAPAGIVGVCTNCREAAPVNSQGLCIECFSGGTPS